MPREAARAGLVDAVLPLPEIAQTLVTLTRERSG
jgi:chemotaxis response regulator CheB